MIHSYQVREVAQELQRSRATKGIKVNNRQLLAEVALLDRYSRLPTQDFTEIRDINDRKVHVILAGKRPVLVPQGELDCDLFVFIETSLHDVTFMGWIAREDVEEAPVHWTLRMGKRVNYSHAVWIDFLWPMPADFLFAAPCEHDAAYWDYELEGWMCFLCGTAFYDAWTAERARKDDGRERHTATA